MKNDTTLANQTVVQKAHNLKCHHRLGFHIAAPAGWINDPNGLCFHNGLYHAFYQHHPYSSDWGPMHWGHVTSTDMVRWQHQPIALAPGAEGTCFSGSAFSVGDTLALLYTGHTWLAEEGDDDHMKQVQCLATSEDGIHFEKQGVVIADAPKSDMVHFRDPKVWQEDGIWHMVVGMKDGEQGQIGYYQSDDLRDWQYRGVMAEATDGIGFMWECPDFFSLGDKRVLICSPMGMEADGYNNLNFHQNGYMVGDLDKQTCRFSFDKFVELDFGHDFYACQTFDAQDGRRVAVAWMDMWHSEMPTKARGWCGALTLPRKLTLDDTGKIWQTPIQELTTLRQEQFDTAHITQIDSQILDTEIRGDLLEVKARFSLAGASAERFGFMLRVGEAPFERTLVGYDRMAKRAFIDRTLSGEAVTGMRSVDIDTSNNCVEFHLYLDRSSVEAFLNQGEQVMTSRIYPAESSLGFKLFAENGSVELESLAIWRLEDIWR